MTERKWQLINDDMGATEVMAVRGGSLYRTQVVGTGGMSSFVSVALAFAPDRRRGLKRVSGVARSASKRLDRVKNRSKKPAQT